MSLTEIRKYTAEDLENVAAIFRSNILKYFGPDEEAGLRHFLADARSYDYFVVELNGETVGAGGIALNEDETVSLCWGMVHSNHLGTGLGKQLTQHRIDATREKYGRLPLVISTSRHTRGFTKSSASG